MQSKWYTLYTRENYEMKVVSYFTKKGISCFCPINRVVKNGIFNQEVIKNQPLFKEYVFINIEDNRLSIIKENNHVINYVYWLGRPVILSEFEIENIRSFVLLHRNIILEKTEVRINRATESGNIFMKYYTSENALDEDKNKSCLTIHSLGFRLISEKKVNQLVFRKKSDSINQLEKV